MKKYFILAAVFLALLAVAGVSLAAIMPPPEPVPMPTDISDCKKGGWMNYGDLFKNQGDCVSFVATDGKNLPDGI